MGCGADRLFYFVLLQQLPVGLVRRDVHASFRNHSGLVRVPVAPLMQHTKRLLLPLFKTPCDLASLEDITRISGFGFFSVDGLVFFHFFEKTAVDDSPVHWNCEN